MRNGWKKAMGLVRSGAAALPFALLAACGGGGGGGGESAAPVASASPPPPLTCPSAQVTLCTDQAQADALRAALADATDRVLPGISGTTRTEVATRLSALRTAIDGGQVGAARDAILNLEIHLDANRNASPTERASLDHIGLAMLRAAALVASGITQYPR